MIVNFRAIGVSALLIAAVAAAGPAARAATDCKAIEAQKDCLAASDCSWVKGYTISKGKQAGKKVEAFCRKKPAPRAKTAKAGTSGAAGTAGMSGMAAGGSADAKK